MFGYVKVNSAELKMKDFELYNGYYCGVCKSIGTRFGQLPRLTLSYDSAFLAIVLASLSAERPDIAREHCVAHHIKKKTIVREKAVDFAADVMLIMAYHKLTDDINDEGSFKARTERLLVKGAYGTLKVAHPGLCELVEKKLAELSALEKEKSGDLDRTADATAAILEGAVYCWADEEMSGKDGGPVLSEGERRILGRLAYSLGRWIYFIDAFDDLFEDIDEDNYNPFIYRFELDREKESKDDFRKRIYPYSEQLLLTSLADLAAAADLLDIKRNKDIIDNVIFSGLLKQTDDILGRDKIMAEKSDSQEQDLDKEGTDNEQSV